ncbi:MAG: cation transporter [bacterium (Candidatus Ratteibacteria) CG15_BIG_FIL_POST_REV_8_21_14_020_41_12]|uniref:Cation transporter n=1 Tax=bacterium (Candidatus Ratteibacteria) CG15_BIG_FIL_POST_REV_8_21_14_020_41_12 TaxID=2014291 RepID=A0A2M7GZ48_9BACT|nr:MAG: cation transporter [bacterium (Candidatus Ratteibacteria) CG15_BIG_FIL_POST_REV_8_21_14_020_41_12]
MILRPKIEELKVIGYYVGKLIIGLGISMFIPLLVAVYFKEWNPALDFLLASLISFTAGHFLLSLIPRSKEMNWTQGMVVASLCWLLAMFLGAIPLYLSGHFANFLDACFDAMSGFATTGLTLIRDLDHLSYSHNIWRHLMMFIGGQGIVVIALTFFVRGVGSAFSIYVGEAREEKILPNVIQTARFIWLVSFVWLVLGTLLLAGAGIFEGMKPSRAFLHGLMLFMAGWDTGGFAPQSQNILYYHSSLFETITLIIFIIGSLNFGLHYALWTGNRKEIYRNVETATFFITILVTFALVVVGLVKTSFYSGNLALFRRSFYQLLSGHSGTGYMTIYKEQFVQGWGPLALFGLIIAMGIGGCSSSTSGGIKILRVGILFRGFLKQVRELMLPESGVIVQKFHHFKERILEDSQVKSAALILLAYVFLYLFGAVAGMFFGYPFELSLFESVSAGANVGLSCGITSESMPVLLKVVYIFQMWCGRLEFMAVFVLFGFIGALIRGK